MYLVKYHKRVMIDSFTCRDVQKSFTCRKIDIIGGVAYCYRAKYAVVTLYEDEVDEIEDFDYPGAYIDVRASFRAEDLAYDLPF